MAKDEKKYDSFEEWSRQYEDEEKTEYLMRHGLMKRPELSAWQKLKLFPVIAYLWIGRKLRWYLWDRWVYQKRLAIQTARMKELAGIGKPNGYSENIAPVKVGTIADPNIDHKLGDIHRESIKKIEREPLPKPDVDDSGLN